MSNRFREDDERGKNERERDVVLASNSLSKPDGFTSNLDNVFCHISELWLYSYSRYGGLRTSDWR